MSDGTTGGTRSVKDITPGPADSAPYNLKAVGRLLLFFRYISETPTAPARNELWRSDGTEAGTVQIRHWSETSLSYSQAVVNGTLFFVFTDLAHGSELWKTDGTSAGTVLVKDIVPGSGSAYPFGLRAVGRYVFFTATEPVHGAELWRTDGTLDGTVLIADMTPGPGSRFLKLLEAVGNSIYFAMAEPSDGSTLLFRLRNTARASG